ncbi:MAG: PTS sugar transporter subunit IIA [Deltaproteobacteria bacterium]|nr:PTS sugar transporter subunit IIA [Deltaproteobacteria bacterium]MBI2341177.1 PTS sugar transporter subunit IIA [Deltaproteobacteria bacterium]
MMLCHYLTPHNIVVLPKPASKDELLKDLAAKLANLAGVRNPSHMVQSILDREHEGSTFLPTGIAIPHARVPDVAEISVIMGVVPEGFKESEDVDPTYIFLLFFSPVKEKEFGKHLKLLARISAVFRDPNFVKEVASSNNPDKVFSLIQQKERETVEE